MKELTEEEKGRTADIIEQKKDRKCEQRFKEAVSKHKKAEDT